MWLGLKETAKQNYTVLRLYAPKKERILLDFNPLKMSEEHEFDPMYEEWHCYKNPLRIYSQDYEMLVGYFSAIYPTKDALNGTPEYAFDFCFDNWIGRENWKIIINEIEKDLDNHSEDEKNFLLSFLKWLKEALKYTDIIVVEGNL